MNESHATSGDSSHVSRMPSHDAIAQCAEELWVQYGRPINRDLEIWLEAERLLSSAARHTPGEKFGSGASAGRSKSKSSRA